MKGRHGCEMDELKELAHIDWWYVLIALVVLLVAIKLVWSLLDWLFVEKLGLETKKMKQRREDSEKLKTTAELAKTTAENLDKLRKRHTKDEEEFRKNLNNYMDESRKDRKVLHDEIEAQKKMQGCQSAITDKVDSISKKLDEMEKKENKRVQSEIKERIAQSYREYKKTKTITPEELEALEDLIETYEAHGGENSFVHSLVQKEMYTWEVE
jgi:rubrerythrin